MLLLMQTSPYIGSGKASPTPMLAQNPTRERITLDEDEDILALFWTMIEYE